MSHLLGVDARMPMSRLHPTVFSSSTFPHVTDTSSVFVHCYMESFLETIRHSHSAAMDEASIGHSSHCSRRVLSCTTNQTTGRIQTSSDHRHELLPARGTQGGLQTSAMVSSPPDHWV